MTVIEEKEKTKIILVEESSELTEAAISKGFVEGYVYELTDDEIKNYIQTKKQTEKQTEKTKIKN